jgi:hypothetical protein
VISIRQQNSEEITAIKDVTPPKGILEIESTNILSGDNYG